MIERGHQRVNTLKEADTALIGTCVVIKKTEERMKRRIEELKELVDDVIVTGCLTKTGLDGLNNICPKARVITPDEIGLFGGTYKEQGHIGILPISSGCLGNCTYCITKVARGELKSRDPESILERFNDLVDAGVKEIQITCQDTASYGLDIGTDLVRLMNKLLEKSGDYRIRIGMMNPDTAWNIIDGLVEVYRSPNVYRFVHIPLQSGSDRVLKGMNRKYTSEEWLNLVDEFREGSPDITLSTDVIAGFPGESEEDFDKTLDVIEKGMPDILNITRFSPRPATKAYDMKDRVHSRKKKERSKQLTELHQKISRENNMKFVGRRKEMIIMDKGKNDTLKGRMDNYKVVVLDEQDEELIGRRVEVDIIGAEDVYLMGEMV